MKGYEQAGASAISVLTDSFFDGKNEDLEEAFSLVGIPLLRKDFIIDPYQIIESKSLGASAILLIAAILTGEEVKEFSKIAYDLELEVLFEIHSIEELDLMAENIRIVGVNNRDLKTFGVDIQNSRKTLKHIPEHMIKVAESGINSAEVISELYRMGFDAFLIGENFMKEKDPAHEARNFINKINK